MKFDPPVITHIDQVLPHIADKPEIILIEKDDYKVLDYVYATSDTFNNPYAKECRGLKFDNEGNLIARPYHKFHNVGENEEYATANLDLSLRHHRLDKLDGSMVHSARLGGRYRLMTRKGESEVAQNAMAFLEADPRRFQRYKSIMDSMPTYTFIYEYVGPENKIVIDYKNEDLILTGIRQNTNGIYTDYEIMLGIAQSFGVPVVGLYDRDDVTSDDEKEGCVIRWSTGFMAKMKSDIYVRKHRSKDLVCDFKALISLIVSDTLDDVLPQLDDEIRKRVIEYRDELQACILHEGKGLNGICNIHANWSQKEFALMVKEKYPSLSSPLFNTRKSGDGPKEIKHCIQRACSDRKRLTALFEDLNFPIWQGDFFKTE